MAPNPQKTAQAGPKTAAPKAGQDEKKPAPKSKVRTAVKQDNQPKPSKTSKADVQAKQKMIRDSFTLPERDYANLGLLKSKCLEMGLDVKKSELVRAGLIALTKMSAPTLSKTLGAVERIKTGRPKK